MQGAALGVRGHDHVDRLGPPVDGPVHVGHPAGPQQRQQRAEAEVAGDPGRVPEGDGRRRPAGLGHAVVEALGAADDDGAPVGLDDLDLDRLLARHLDGLGVPGGPPPRPVRTERLHPGAGPPQPLAVEVLVVGHGVGDGPGDRAGVAEVGDAGDARHSKADHVELRAGQTDLLVDARVLDEAVRVTGDDRVPGDRAVPGDQPAVAARGAGAVRGEQADGVRAEPAGDVLAPELGGEAGEEDVGGEPHRERGPGLPAAGDEARTGEFGGVGGAQPFVHAGHVRPYPLRRPGVGPLQLVPAAAGRVGQAGTADEAVPGERLGAEEGRRGALGAVPFDLELPGPVERGDPALDVREPVRVVRAQMGDAPGIPEDLADHCTLISHQVRLP
ncbi:PE-PGRS family protein [Streptomyces griseoflavus Tu4000]|uniref:PE-PGRS family protein n=1 Tax=Streptomyces griseoflavus Tu4000 TaxID=467200 RepID=D9XQZ9_9ACTN|nr:PE-PGRS family protein [Streptomyces griseoflavus Tu4000]